MGNVTSDHPDLVQRKKELDEFNQNRREIM
jgi:hypothetical protein